MSLKNCSWKYDANIQIALVPRKSMSLKFSSDNLNVDVVVVLIILRAKKILAIESFISSLHDLLFIYIFSLTFSSCYHAIAADAAEHLILI